MGDNDVSNKSSFFRLDDGRNERAIDQDKSLMRDENCAVNICT
jgi:hypothetical protein